MKLSLIILALLVLADVGCADPRTGETAMITPAGEQDIRKKIELYLDSVLNGQDTTFLKHLVTGKFRRKINGIETSLSSGEMGPYLQVFFTAFPDLNIRLEEASIQHGKAFLLWNVSGTNTGIYGEMAATGKKIRIHGMSHMYFNDEGKIYRENVYFNELDLLQQLGYTLVPPILE